MENLKGKRMCLNKLPLLNAMKDGPSWHKILKILQKASLNFHKQDRVIKCAIVYKRYSQKKTCDVNAPCWTFTLKY